MKRRIAFLLAMALSLANSLANADDLIDLSTPDFNPPDCPAWAKEQLPAWLAPYVGKNGLPTEWRPKAMLASAVKGVDRYQANQFVYYGPKTAEYLYREYTPLEVDYKPGTLPAYEQFAASHLAGAKTETAKAVALLMAMPASFKHPSMPPIGISVGPSRNLDDEALLASGCGWCNEQARVFIRLCQVAGIPARMIHLFGQNHTVAEFYADGHWALADATNFFVVPATNTRVADDKLLSVAECHDGSVGQQTYAEAKRRRMNELIKMSDAELGFKTPGQARRWRAAEEAWTVDELARRTIGFGVVNYPLPK